MNVIDNFPVAQACQVLAEMMHLVVLFEIKIEAVKEKLCGFDDFSVETAFKSIDAENKGYLTVHDLRLFLEKNIFPRDIEILLSKYGNLQRLSFLGFLRVIKPYFNKKLAEEIALRGKKKSLNQEYKLLLAEILTFTFVMVGELEKLKERLSRDYCLNPGEIRRLICGRNMVESPMGEVVKFIKRHGFDVDEEKVRYIECYLNSKIDLYDDHLMHLLFLPTHLNSVYREPEELINEAEVGELPTVSKSNFLGFKYPGASAFVPLELVSKNIQKQPTELSMGILNGFMLKTQQSHRQDRSFIHQIDSPPKLQRQFSPVPPLPPHYISPRDDQGRASTPFLDMFLKSNNSQKFYPKKQPIINPHQKNLVVSGQQITPIKNRLRENIAYENINSPYSLPRDTPVRNVLDGFYKTDKKREQFDDSVSQESQSAFKYV